MQERSGALALLSYLFNGVLKRDHAPLVAHMIELQLVDALLGVLGNPIHEKIGLPVLCNPEEQSQADIFCFRGDPAQDGTETVVWFNINLHDFLPYYYIE